MSLQHVEAWIQDAPALVKAGLVGIAASLAGLFGAGVYVGKLENRVSAVEFVQRQPLPIAADVAAIKATVDKMAPAVEQTQIAVAAISTELKVRVEKAAEDHERLDKRDGDLDQRVRDLERQKQPGAPKP